MQIGLILLVFAFVLACIASRIPGVAGWNLGWLAIAVWIASELFGRIVH